MRLAAFLHGYPPLWSMGGEVSTHRTLREVPNSVVVTNTDVEYWLDGVQVVPEGGSGLHGIMEDAEKVGASVLYAHSALSKYTVLAAKRMRLPSILAVHAPPRFAPDLRRAWPSASIRLYNTEAARKEWRDPSGWLLHPPVGPEPEVQRGSHDALTLTSSLLNKGVTAVLELARRTTQRVIIVESPAHATHGSPAFWEEAARLPNVEIWPRVHPDKMGRLWAETQILLVPSRYETYGMSAMEAAWHGVPSIHVDTVHVREGIGDAARLLRTGSADELEQAVAEIQGDRAKWSQRARERVEALREREVEELAAFAGGVAGLTCR